MSDLPSLMGLGGHALLQAMNDIASKDLGCDSPLVHAITEALKSKDLTRLDLVQRALNDLPEETQHDIMRQTHQKLVLGGFCILGGQSLGGRDKSKPPTKH